MLDQGPCVLVATSSFICSFDGGALVERVEYQPDDVGTIEARTEARGGKEIGGLIPAAVDMPSDQILAAG